MEHESKICSILLKFALWISYFCSLYANVAFTFSQNLFSHTLVSSLCIPFVYCTQVRPKSQIITRQKDSPIWKQARCGDCGKALLALSSQKSMTASRRAIFYQHMVITPLIAFDYAALERPASEKTASCNLRITPSLKPVACFTSSQFLNLASFLGVFIGHARR